MKAEAAPLEFTIDTRKRIKSVDWQAAAMVSKTRALLLRQRTRAINALRGHLAELSVIAAISTAKLARLIEVLRDEEDVCLPKAAVLTLAENPYRAVDKAGATADLLSVPAAGHQRVTHSSRKWTPKTARK